MTDNDIDDLIGEFTVDGKLFKVVTSHVVVKDLTWIDIIRAGGEFPTDFFLTVPYPTFKHIRDNGLIEDLMTQLEAGAPEYLSRLDD